MLVRQINDELCTIQYNKNNIYQGYVKKNKLNNSSNITYIPHGYGKSFNENYNYHGYFNEGKKNGFGFLTYKSKINPYISYEGYFKDDKKHGEGILKRRTNDEKILIYEGEFFNDLKHGKCVEYFENSKTKHTLIYNMGHTNSMKPYNYNNSLFKINGFIHNNKIIGPIKIMKGNLVFYQGEFDNNIQGNGIIHYYENYENRLVTIEAPNITLDGVFSPNKDFNNIYLFQGKITVNTSSLYINIIKSLIPEYIRCLDHKFRNIKVVLVFKGKFAFVIDDLSNISFLDYGKFTFEIFYKNNTIASGNSTLKYDSIDPILEQINESIKNNKTNVLYWKSIIKSIFYNTINNNTPDIKDETELNYLQDKLKRLELYSETASLIDSKLGDCIDSDYDSSSDSSSESNEYMYSQKYKSFIQYKIFIKKLQNKSNIIIGIEDYQKSFKKLAELISTINELYKKTQVDSECVNSVIRILLEKINENNIHDLIVEDKSNIKSKLYIFDENRKYCDKYELTYYTNNKFLIGSHKIIDNSNELTQSIGIYNIHDLKESIFSIFYKNKDKHILKIKYYANMKEEKNNNLFTIQFFSNLNIIEYIGKLKNTFKNGFGVEFWRNSKKKYIGQYVNDIPHGEGSLYDDNESIIFTGQFSDGAPGGF
jgi:hypothetical protein